MQGSLLNPAHHQCWYSIPRIPRSKECYTFLCFGTSDGGTALPTESLDPDWIVDQVTLQFSENFLLDTRQVPVTRYQEARTAPVDEVSLANS
jgi:hypothetical protein